MSEPLQAAQISANQLPVIDVSGLSSSKAQDRSAVGARIRTACVTHGFFYVANHGIPQRLIDAVQEQAKALFDLPANEQRKLPNSFSHCNPSWDPREAQ